MNAAKKKDHIFSPKASEFLFFVVVKIRLIICFLDELFF